MELEKLLDIHTHHTGREWAILSLPPAAAIAGCDTPYSLELHPWKLVEKESVEESLFREAAQKLQGDPNLLAIGECGLDNKCGVPLERQLSAFQLALSTAYEMNLPIIIHCVGYWSEMMSCVKEYYPLPSVKGWGGAIIHGYRKGPQLTQQLIDAGFHLSLGEKFNPEVARIIPEERLFFETDESNSDIWEIRKKILSLREFYRKIGTK